MRKKGLRELTWIYEFLKKIENKIIFFSALQRFTHSIILSTEKVTTKKVKQKYKESTHWYTFSQMENNRSEILDNW